MKKIAITAMLSLVGCSWFSTKATATEAAFVSCAKADVTANVAGATATVIEAVTQILASGSADYAADLDALGVKVGMDVLACAIEAVREVFLAQSAAGSGLVKLTAEPSPVIGRADAYLAAQGVRFAP